MTVEDLIDVFRQNNIKVTPQRVEIYRYLSDTKDHPSADTVYSNLRKVFPSISFNTVYTTLLLYAELGLLHVAESFGDAKRFDADISSHGHFRCTKCGAIEDFEYEADIETIIPKSVAKRLVRKRLVVEGLCKNCSKII
jgi:Fur family transcriptional regulator, peroxide stress response regulator